VIPDLRDDAHLRRLLILTAILLMAIPTLQVAFQILPLQPGNIQWRFATANALSGGILLPSFAGLTLLLTVGRRLGSPTLQRVAGALAILLVLLIGASLALFVLDAAQLKAVVNSQMAVAFRNTTMRVGVVSGVFLLAFGMLALAAFMPPKGKVAGSRPSGRDEDDVGLIVGRSYS